ncbi:hypothetical protein HDU98_012267, partial [Podochytrium sp. JEL0797]
MSTKKPSAAASLAHKLLAQHHHTPTPPTSASHALAAEAPLDPEHPSSSSDEDHDDDDESSMLLFADMHLSKKSLYINQTDAHVAKLTTLLTSRIEQGQGEAVLEIGVEDDGTSMHLTKPEFDESLKNLTRCADALLCDVTVLHERRVLMLQMSNNLTSTSSSSADIENNVPATNNSQVTSPTSPQTPDLESAAKSHSPPDHPPAPMPSCTSTATTTDPLSSSAKEGAGYYYAHVLIRKRAGQIEDMNELRIAVVGNVDAGKSTLLGVLTKNVLDDGRGKARVNLFRHKHELETGRTSSVGLEIMGFTSMGQVVTSELVHGPLTKQKLNWDDVTGCASKVISFFDLAGHEKYLKTTVFGMTGCSPDFVMLMIGANAGIIGMTK